MAEYSAEEIEKLKVFRIRVKDALKNDYHRNDAFLLTWLRARQLNIDKAEEMFRNSMEWRKVNKVDGILERESIPEKYVTPFAYCGLDKATGCPVFLYLMGRHDIRSILEAEGPEKIVRHNIIFMETIMKLMRELSETYGKPVTQFIEIIDLEHYSFTQIATKQCLTTLAKAQLLMDLNYPEVIRHITLINAPKVFALLYNFMKPMIPKETLAKIDILGPDAEKWKQFVNDKYPMELIPKRWGGTLKGNDEYCSRSTIWMFGQLSIEFFTQADEHGFIKSKIRARNKLEIVHDNSESGTLSWIFKTESGYDIGFGVLFGNEEVIPVQRIHTPGIIQEGMLECKIPGKYVVVFDNTYSYTRAKTVHHKITWTPNPTNFKEMILQG